MSASSKKKLRSEQNAAKLTERQLAEQKEAKKLKIYTVSFVIVLVALLVIAVTVGVVQTINNSGVREKNTVAMTIGNHQLNNVEMNYFFIDSVNNFYSSNSSYLSMIGLDASLPLDDQIMDEASGTTWADYFLDSAKATAISVYTMADAAEAAGHTLSQEDQSSADNAVSSVQLYASMYGYSDTDDYLKAMYGNGADEESYRSYVERSLLADSYYLAYEAGLSYDEAALRAAEAENYNKYSAYTYNYYYVTPSRFLEGGTEGEDGTVTYSAEEEKAAADAAEKAAKELAAGKYASTEELDAAIAAMPVNSESSSAKSISYVDQLYTSLDADISKWLAEEGHQEGDMACIPNNTTTTDENGNVVETVSGYYVVYFIRANDNQVALKNARHILVQFQGGTTDEYGYTTYTDEEKATAKTSAQALLDQWKNGEATEESFAALATEKTADTASAANGGLYEDIYPGQMVSAFNDWCFDASRKSGDTGLVESEYGYHVMYFVGDSETTYRDHLIRSELTSNDLAEWKTSVEEAATVEEGDFSHIRTDIILN